MLQPDSEHKIKKIKKKKVFVLGEHQGRWNVYWNAKDSLLKNLKPKSAMGEGKHYRKKKQKQINRFAMAETIQVPFEIMKALLLLSTES